MLNLLILFSFQVFAESTSQVECENSKSPVYYTIQKGDHLADIIRTFGFRPLYGQKSRVTQVSALSEIKDPNHITPGQAIYLPFRCEHDLNKYVLLQGEGARYIDATYLVKVKTKKDG